MPDMNASWAALTEKFAGAGLPLPPVPMRLQDALRTRSDWCWSTKPIDPMAMYMFARDPTFIVDVLHDRVEDYVAISHAGHGINSYAINYHLVHGDLAVLMQVGYGGFEMDNPRNAEKLAGHWAQIAEMLATPPGPRTAAQQRMVIIYSDLRPNSSFGWIRRPMTDEDHLHIEDHPPRAHLISRARQLWLRPQQPDPPAA